jgi:transcription antitermination factor NusG
MSSQLPIVGNWGPKGTPGVASASPGVVPAQLTESVRVLCELSWYAVYTRSRHEKRIAEQLERKQIENFLPSYETVRRWKNGRHRVQLPLFPCYTFVRIALADRLEVLKVPGVVRLVSFNGLPVPLADQEITSLRRVLAEGFKAEPHPYLTVGRRVRLTGGPLVGHEGILVRKKNDLGVVLSIDLIHRSVLVHVDAQFLELAPSAVHRNYARAKSSLNQDQTLEPMFPPESSLLCAR